MSRYPSETELALIKNWPYQDRYGLIEFVSSIWAYREWGISREWKKEDELFEYHISTGGWSGNEDIIRSLKENIFFWAFSWVQSRRGGHYIFEAPLPEGYLKVSNLCKELNISRQAIHKNKDNYDWIIISDHVRYARVKKKL